MSVCTLRSRYGPTVDEVPINEPQVVPKVGPIKKSIATRKTVALKKPTAPR